MEIKGRDFPLGQRFIFVSFVPILFYLWPSLFHYDYINIHFCQICGISHIRVKEFSRCCPKLFDLEYYKESNECRRSSFFNQWFQQIMQ